MTTLTRDEMAECAFQVFTHQKELLRKAGEGIGRWTTGELLEAIAREREDWSARLGSEAAAAIERAATHKAEALRLEQEAARELASVGLELEAVRKYSNR